MNGTKRGLTSSVNNRGKDNGGMLKKIAEEKDINFYYAQRNKALRINLLVKWVVFWTNQS